MSRPALAAASGGAAGSTTIPLGNRDTGPENVKPQ